MKEGRTGVGRRMYLYPLNEMSHEGLLPTRLLLCLPSLRVTEADDEFQIPRRFSEQYILARVHREEYKSRSQLHGVKFYMKPLFQTRNFDYYAFEILEVVKHDGRVPFKRSDTVPVAELGVVAFKVSKGYREEWLVRKLSPREFLDLAEEFTRLYVMHLLLR